MLSYFVVKITVGEQNGIVRVLMALQEIDKNILGQLELLTSTQKGGGLGLISKI